MVVANERKGLLGRELKEPRALLSFCPSLTRASAAALLLLLHLAVNVIKRLLITATTEAAARLSAPESHLPCSFLYVCLPLSLSLLHLLSISLFLSVYVYLPLIPHSEFGK